MTKMTTLLTMFLCLASTIAMFSPNLWASRTTAKWARPKSTRRFGAKPTCSIVHELEPSKDPDNNVFKSATLWPMQLPDRHERARLHYQWRRQRSRMNKERVMCFDEKNRQAASLGTSFQCLSDRHHASATESAGATLPGDPETGNIYAHVAFRGMFFCYRHKDFGKGLPLARIRLTEEYGRISGYGGRINSPAKSSLDGDLPGHPGQLELQQGRSRPADARNALSLVSDKPH